MVEQNIHYCFTLSEEQMKYLRSKKYKIDRMECFMSLVVLAGRETKLVPISKTQQVEILPGQVMVDNTQLAKLWNKDRKTVPKLLEAMESLGISSSQKIGENRIHTLHSLSGWYVDGKFRGNFYSLKPNADKTVIVHADVPPARVITVEVSDDKSKGEESSGSESDNSHNGNMGMNPSANGNVSDAASSESAHYNNSRQSAGTPSSSEEADGNQNEGKRNEGASPQYSGGQGGLSGGYQRQPYNGYQKPNGNDRPDGNK